MEQRRHRRLPASIRIFTRSGPSPFPDPVKDISLGGAHVLTGAPLAPGTEAVFALHLPHHDVPLEVKGHVVWSNGSAMGVQFHGDEPRLTDFVDRLERDATAV
ncbi:MAG: PilZ domain-containing protein [Myxococcaceae bacterium]|nr:PilZ domain-containing protein [Myxococcaceae bacterium]